MSEATTGTLVGTGARPWAELVDAFDGWQATWADLEGWHAGTDLPDDPVGVSMIWAQFDNMLARLRPDGEASLGAVLLLEGGDIPEAIARFANAEEIAEEIVDVRTSSTLDWDENRIGGEFADLLKFHRPIEIVAVEGLRPISFVRLSLPT